MGCWNILRSLCCLLFKLRRPGFFTEGNGGKEGASREAAHRSPLFLTGRKLGVQDCFYIVQDVSYIVQDVSYIVQDVPYIVQDVPYIVQDVSYIVQNSPYIV